MQNGIRNSTTLKSYYDYLRKKSYDKIRLALAYIEKKKINSRCNDYFLPSLLHENTKILILGIPGNASLEKLEYYGHPRNNFGELYFFLRKKAFQHF
jgi:hypothetical protein